MQDWENIFSSYVNSGVYRVDDSLNAHQIKKAALINGLDYTYISLKKALDKNGFLKTVAKALKFPSYFGMNWDALNDSLTDMSWKKATGYVIVFANFRLVSENMAKESEVIKNLLAASAKYWREKKVQFYVILSA